WTPVRVTSATASEALASQWQAAEFERELARLKDEKLTPKKEQTERKDLLDAIAEKKKEAAAKAGRVTPLQIRNGNVEVGPDVPGKVVYELNVTLDGPTITALRIEVDPANADTARHTPEPGFILDRVDAWIVQPGGQEKKITFRYLVPDFESDLEAAI